MASNDQASASGLRTRVSAQVNATSNRNVKPREKMSEVSRGIQPLGCPETPK